MNNQGRHQQKSDAENERERHQEKETYSPSKRTATLGKRSQAEHGGAKQSQYKKVVKSKPMDLTKQYQPTKDHRLEELGDASYLKT